jgi:3-oxoacyl-[acyl-carrier-protein] synthase II
VSARASGIGLWVTGLGLVTPLGLGVEATWERLVRGDRAMGPITRFDVTGQRVGIAGEVDGEDLPDACESRTTAMAGGESRTTAMAGGESRTTAMAAAAAGEAMRASGLDPRRLRVGLVVGGTTGGMLETELLLARLHAEPRSREVPPEMRLHPLTSTGDRLDERLGPFVRIRTISSACSSGANALVVAAAWLLAGDVDAVVAGASDGLCRLTVSGFNALGATDPQACRPFDRRRRGTSLGEGAGFLVIERAVSARARGVAPIAELAGWAVGSEAHHITNPAPDGAVAASLIERAVARAGLSARDVDYVNAHGTGTQHNDSMEAAALARALGPEIARVPVSSSKAQIGHTLGAAGAIEAVITALVVARRTLVPTAGLDEPDPALGLVHVPHVGRSVPRVRAALSNAFGFGGMDTVLVFADPGRETGGSDPTPGAGAVITGAAVFGSCGLLGTEECGALFERRFDPGVPVDPDAHLDAGRARRLDRAARLGAVAVERALVDAGATDSETGLILGSAFGNVDGSAAFIHRILEKGPRAASPAEFPNLVPSSPVGHVSIYAGLRGPSFATADLGTSGESAFAQALQLIAAGEVSRVVAGAVEARGALVERILAPLFAYPASQGEGPRGDVAAVVVVESDAEARRRGARGVARVRQALEWRGQGPGAGELLSPRGERGGEVVLARTGDGAGAWLDGTAWSGCPRRACAPAVGESDALGAVALAAAVGRIATDRADEVLVLGLARGRGYAIVLARE